jgi:hypothetical protein
MPPDWNVVRESKRDKSKVHTIEVINDGHYLIDYNIDVKYVEQFGNDNGWCVFNKDTFYQKVYDHFEDALLRAIGQSTKDKKIMPPPAGL